MARALALWAVLFGLYAATLGVDAVPGSRYAGAEPHHLLAAESIVSDGDVDLTDEYAARVWEPWVRAAPAPRAAPLDGRLHEPEGVGFGAVVAPAYAVGGPVLVDLLCAALAALAFVVGAALARVAAPEPWASGAALVAGASAPALAFGTTVLPHLAAGLLLAGACVLALRMREHGRVRDGVWAGVLLALLPWLGTWYLLPAVPVTVAMVAWTWTRGRGVAGLAAVEVLAVSLITWVRVNEVLYGGVTPEAAALPGVVEPARTAWWWWAPVAALLVGGLALAVRSLRSRVARVVPERAEAEQATALALGVCVGAAATAVASGTGDALVLALPVVAAPAAWALRGLPRAGAVAAIGVVATSAWVLVAVWTGGRWVS